MASRHYPLSPVVGVGAVIVTTAGSVVLVRRRNPPLQGRWTLPGGAIELGEPIRAAVAREVLEETNLIVDVGPIVEAVDHLEVDEEGRVAYHFVIVDYLCRPRAGELQPGTDVDGALLADPSNLDPYALTERSVAVIGRGLELYTGWGA